MNVTARPALPALAVLPTLWLLSLLCVGMSKLTTTSTWGIVKASRSNVSGEENRSRFSFKLIQTRQPLVLTHLPIKRYSCESETSEQERKSESGAASAAKDHEGVAGQLVEDVHQVDLLELERDEEIILQQLFDHLITSRNFNLNRMQFL